MYIQILCGLCERQEKNAEGHSVSVWLFYFCMPYNMIMPLFYATSLVYGIAWLPDDWKKYYKICSKVQNRGLQIHNN